MSEVLDSIHQEKETQDPEMSIASICTRGQRSLQPLKRKTFGQPLGEDTTEYPLSKRFLNEELMASHLEHLNLSCEGHRLGNEPQPSTANEPKPLPQYLSIKTVASCPQSLECRVSRKRYPTTCCLGPGDHGHRGGDLCSQPGKRMKLDTAAADSSDQDFTNKHHMRTGHRNGSATPTSAHSVGNASDLTSIPEEIESQQSSSLSPNSTAERSAPSAGGDERGQEPVSPSQLGPSLQQPLSLCLPPDSNLHPDSELRSVWLAPELQIIHAQSDPSPLPVSIVKEIKSKNMALVPWVAVDTLLKTNPKGDCKDNDGNGLPSSSPENTSKHQTDEPYQDSEMELN